MVQKSVARGGQKGLSKTKKLLVVVGLLILVVAAAVFVARAQHQHTISTDKARFAQAEKDVQTVAQQIISVAGQPADQRTNNYCSRPHQKLNTGSLGCYTQQLIVFPLNNFVEANRLMGTISNTLHDSSLWQFEGMGETPYELSPQGLTPNNEFISFRQPTDLESKGENFVDSLTHMPCLVDYVYFSRSSITSGYPDFNYATNQALLTQLSCGQTAKAQYYPLQD